MASAWRWQLVVGVLAFAFLAVFVRLGQLHLAPNETLLAKAEGNRALLKVTAARRGDIVDRHGQPLATTRPLITLGVDPGRTDPAQADAWEELRVLLDAPADAWADHFQPARRGDRPVRWRKLADDLDEATYARVLALGVDGVYGNRRFERYYPGGELAAHVIGFVNNEGTAAMGVEAFLDDYLQGAPGWVESEADAFRRERPEFRYREVAPRHGDRVRLTLDTMTQHLVEEEIAYLLSTYTPDAVSILVSDPQTGELLALANYPTFDLNAFGSAPIDLHRNRALTDLIEPGSTFKIVPIAAVMNEGLVAPQTQLNCNVRAVSYLGRTISLPSDHRPLGRLDIVGITRHSSNRGVAQLAMILGEQRMYDYARAFGFGTPTGLGLTGESEGILHPVEDWDGLTISRLPCGYAVAATPLQVHTAMGAVANEGILMQPQVVAAVETPDGAERFVFAPKPVRRVLSRPVARTMAAMLTEVVSLEGTARRAMLPGFAVAGKTGTARKIIDGQYSESHHVASFSGFFPAAEPYALITVVVDNPQLDGTGYGGVVAAPAFKRLAEKLIAYHGWNPAAAHLPRFAASSANP